MEEKEREEKRGGGGFFFLDYFNGCAFWSGNVILSIMCLLLLMHPFVVRNLRIREDTAKYLLNLDVNSAHYDPKTRSMREDPLPDMDPNEKFYAVSIHSGLTLLWLFCLILIYLVYMLY